MSVDEESLRQEIKTVLEDGEEGMTPRNVKERVARNLGIPVQEMSNWKTVLKEELQPYLGDKSGSLSPKQAKRKSEHNSENPNPAKIAKSELTQGIALSDNRKVKLSEFKGRNLIDIREYYEKDGEEKPGAKGIALTAEQWQILSGNVSEISKAVEDEDIDYFLDLGNDRMVTIGNYKGALNVNIREFYSKDHERLPGKKGISLSVDQWQILATNVNGISPHIPATTKNSSNPGAKSPDQKATAGSSIASKDENFTELGKNRRASVSDFKGKKLLNLREYYEKDGQLLPGKKGISLTKDQAQILSTNADNLTEKLDAKEEHTVDLGNRRRAQISNFKGRWSVDVREFYEKDGEEKPGAKGLSMPSEQWNILAQDLGSLVSQL